MATQTLTAQRADDVAAPAGGPRNRMYAPLYTEYDYFIEETEGALPDELVGTLYRNNGGKYEAGGQHIGHLFDGEGMLSMYAIEGGRVRFRTRFVQTNHFLAGLNSQGLPTRSFGTVRAGGALRNAFRMPASKGNTNVMLHAGELLAMYESGKPHALDPDTLDTRGKHDFHGALGSPIWVGAFSAHPKIDPKTGELYNFGFEALPRPRLKCYRVDRSGALHSLRDVHLPEAVWNHDVGLTERHMAFVLSPLTFDKWQVAKFALGFTSFDQMIRYTPDIGTTVVLVPRDGGKPRVLQTDALMQFHINNAYEDGSDTVVELVEWTTPWDELNAGLRNYDRFPDVAWTTGGILTRLRITPDGRVLRERMSDEMCEWPQFDWRLSAQAHRYTYVVSRTGSGTATNAVSKVDCVTGERSTHSLPDGHHLSETVFVPRAQDADEDDGWLLGQAYDPTEHRSRLVVLDARNLEAEPLFVGHLKHHIPQSYHGTFTSRVARPGPLVPAREVAAGVRGAA
jgi:all-trans-8'-apo-beta-carotenal 15,15'-oxygenase